MKLRIATLILMGLLSGCGNPLGKYDVRRVTLVPGSTLKTVDPDGCSSCDSKPQLLRIEFVSTTDLETASGGHALYIHGDFCPFKNEFSLGYSGHITTTNHAYSIDELLRIIRLRTGE